MKQLRGNKRGFTLVEMMLALAIIVIIGWTTVALMVATKDSFMTTYNTNDSSDYAVLYCNGFENAFLRNTQDKSVKSPVSFTINPTNQYLMEGSNPVFTPKQMKTKSVNPPYDVVDKWTVRMYFYVNPEKDGSLVNFRVYLIDNYYSPTPKIMCVQEDSVWAPHLDNDKLTPSNNLSGDTADEAIRAAYPELTDDGWTDTITFKGN